MYSDFSLSSFSVGFANPEGAALGFFLAGIAAGVWLARDRSLRSALSSFGLVIAMLGAFQVLDSLWFVVAMTLLMVTGTAVWRALPILPNAPIVWLTDGLIPRTLQAVGEWRGPTDSLLPIATTAMGTLATVWLVVRVYLPIISDAPSGVPFVDPAGATLAVYLIGLAAVAWIGGRSVLREPLAALGLLVVAWACIPEFDGVTLIAAWATLMVLGFAMWRGLAALPDAARIALIRSEPVWMSDLVLLLAALATGTFAALHVLLDELPLVQFGQVTPPEVPFTDAGAVAALILTIAVLAVGVLVRGALARRVSILVAGGIVAYAIPYEVYAWAVSVLWVGLGGLALVLIRVDRVGREVFLVSAGVMVAAAAAVAVAIVAPPSGLVVGWDPLEPIVLLQSIAALGTVVAGLVAIARAARPDSVVRWVWIAAGVTTLYLLSIAVVGAVATQVGGTTPTEELQTQGQVALSVLWAVLGLAAFVAGLRLRILDLRHAGLALLALATAKVFLFDLSALDVAYRVISLIALGLLLLTSAWVWQRLQPRPPTTPTAPGPMAA
jgi:Predicted membrane protein